MQNISIEKCLDIVSNKYKLVLLAMERAKHLMLGAEPQVEKGVAQKNSYLALQEIEHDKLDLIQLEEDLKTDLSKSDFFVKSNAEHKVDTSDTNTENEDTFDLDEIIDEELESVEANDEDGYYDSNDMDDTDADSGFEE